VPIITIKVPNGKGAEYEIWKANNTANFNLPSGKTLVIEELP
jgi:hypothetical protein